jgi:hypothetical protein
VLDPAGLHEVVGSEAANVLEARGEREIARLRVEAEEPQLDVGPPGEEDRVERRPERRIDGPAGFISRRTNR